MKSPLVRGLLALLQLVGNIGFIFQCLFDMTLPENRARPIQFDSRMVPFLFQ